jgi:eukaryotic-like serine/threonine-protein kinase
MPDLPSEVSTRAPLSNAAIRTQPPEEPTANQSVVPLPAAPSGYELLDEIGRGGMGIAYRARDLTLAREVAVKLLPDGYTDSSTVARRFVEEAQITGQLQHPGIPAVYQTGMTPDARPFLAMKLVRGRTLAQILADRTDSSADRSRFLAIFEHVCHAVGYAHAHDIIHRDLKPSNIMVGAFNEVQVMDWGLAKVVTRTVTQDPSAVAEVDLERTCTEIGSYRSGDLAKSVRKK